MKPAVVLIDVQRVFETGAHKAHAVETVIGHLNRVTRLAPHHGVPIILIQHSAR